MGEAGHPPRDALEDMPFTLSGWTSAVVSDTFLPSSPG